MIENSEHESARTLVLLGNSIVYGWGVLRRQRYANILQELVENDSHLCGWHIIAEGVPGDTVLQGVARFARDVIPHEPDAVIVAFGLNDGALNKSDIDVQRERLFLARTQPWWLVWFRLRKLASILRHNLGIKAPLHRPVRHEAAPRVRPQHYCAGLRDLIDSARRLGANPILLDLVPSDEARLGADQLASYAKYRALTADIARLTDTPLIHLVRPSNDIPLHMADGVHLTAEGHRWLAEQIHNQLGQVLS